MNQIDVTGELPEELKQKIFAMRPELGELWQIIESPLLEELRTHKRFKSFAALPTLKTAIRLHARACETRIPAYTKVALGEFVIPDREVLDRILRYGTAIERNLGRALD